MFATFARSGRVHAVAARIERHKDRWRLVALQIG
ncbi:MAG: Rv3235 family protein [Mycobacterium sp.]